MTTTTADQTRGRIWQMGPWYVPYRGTNILCSDGVRRTARTAPAADTFFSLPATVQVKGKTISGFIMKGSDGDLRFVHYTHRKNGHVLPEWAD